MNLKINKKDAIFHKKVPNPNVVHKKNVDFRISKQSPKKKNDERKNNKKFKKKSKELTCDCSGHPNAKWQEKKEKGV